MPRDSHIRTNSWIIRLRQCTLALKSSTAIVRGLVCRFLSRTLGLSPFSSMKMTLATSRAGAHGLDRPRLRGKRPAISVQRFGGPPGRAVPLVGRRAPLKSPPSKASRAALSRMSRRVPIISGLTRVLRSGAKMGVAVVATFYIIISFVYLYINNNRNSCHRCHPHMARKSSSPRRAADPRHDLHVRPFRRAIDSGAAWRRPRARHPS